MTFQRNDIVRHPKRPAWGLGRVLDVQWPKIHVQFESGAPKTLDASIVQLEKVGNGEGSKSIAFKIDIELVRRLCKEFTELMEHNRKTFNDGGMAQMVIDEIERRGELSPRTEKRLLAWCYTDGAVFQDGVPLARRICEAIYGYLLPDPDRER